MKDGANRIGMNTAISEAVIAMMVKPISLAPSSEGCSGVLKESRWRI
jgi:hypothetical protein